MRGDQSSLRIGRRRWRLLSVILHDFFHDDFFFVVQVVALDTFGGLAAVEIEVVMQGDAAGESLTLMLPQLVRRALPPEVAVGLVWNGDFPPRFRLGVLLTERVGGKSQVEVIFERVGNHVGHIFVLCMSRRSKENRRTQRT